MANRRRATITFITTNQKVNPSCPCSASSMIPHWLISNRWQQYVANDLTLSGLHPLKIKFKKLEESVFTIQQVSTDHFLAWTEGELHWSAEATDSCKWETLGTVRGPQIIMAYQKNLPFENAIMLGVEEQNRLIVKTKEYACTWYLIPTG